MRQANGKELWKSPWHAFRRNSIALILYGLLKSLEYTLTYGNLGAPDFWEQQTQGVPPTLSVSSPGYQNLSAVIQALIDNDILPQELKKRIRRLLAEEGVVMVGEKGQPLDPDTLFANSPRGPFFLKATDNRGKVIVFRIEIKLVKAGTREASITAFGPDFSRPGSRPLGKTSLAFEALDSAVKEREAARLNDLLHQTRNLPEGYRIQNGTEGRAEAKFRSQIRHLSVITGARDLADQRDASWPRQLLFGSHSLPDAALDISRGLTAWLWNDMANKAKPIANPRTEVNDRLFDNGPPPEGFADGARITEKRGSEQ